MQQHCYYIWGDLCIWRLSILKIYCKWLWLFNYQGPSFALLDWYNQTLRFSCNIIVIIYEGIDIWRLSILKKLKPAIWGVHHINLLNWYNQTLRFSCNNIVIIYEEIYVYEGCRYWKYIANDCDYLTIRDLHLHC